MNCLMVPMTQNLLRALYNETGVIFEYGMRNIVIIVNYISFIFITYFIRYIHFDLTQDQ